VNYLKKALIAVITFYQQYLRCLFVPCCRFYPTCSEYTKSALEKYGLLKGLSLGIRRLLRCHPYSGQSGFDPLN